MFQGLLCARMKRLSLTILAVFLALPVLARGDGAFFGGLSGGATTQTRLLLAAESAKPGDTVWAGLELKMAPGWHTYWRNGGDAGLPTTVTWTLPPGVSAGEIAWPIPEKSVTPAGDTPLYTYGYEDTVVLLVPIKLAADLRPGPVQLGAEVAWMECKDTCNRYTAKVSASLTVGSEDKRSANADSLELWRARLPQTNAPAPVTARWESAAPGSPRAVVIDWAAGNMPFDFYPYENQGADVQGATVILPGEPGHVRLRKMVNKGEGSWPERLIGIVVFTNEMQQPAAVEENLPLQPPAAGATSPVTLVVELLIAFLAGLILNVMPCVLPVIALKALGFVNQSREEPGRVRRLGWVYGAGVLVSFLALAGLAIAAKQAGGAAGWGDALRHPQFRVILTVLMTLIALNLFGLFEVTLGAGVMGSAAGLASRRGYGGAFCNGVLATILATPCTAPYLAGALAFALTQPPPVTLLVFLAIGTGLAFPFVLVCSQPRLLKALPKPGPWMEQFKIAMGFPMLATAMWLAYGSTRNQADMLLLEFFLVLLALAAWVWGRFVQRGTRRKGLAAALCLLLVAADGFVAPQISPMKTAAIDWRTWSLQAVEQARKEGHPVLVDFTAKTCLNCIVNKASSLEIAQTRAKLREIGAVSFEADFTDEDPLMARELARWKGSAGVPLVLVYSKDLSREPQVLPAILTPSIVLNALDQAAK
jgi:thiol:disulfide interchange protein DsbD